MDIEAADDLLFKVGQSVETKSFIEGYRGAWFRSKIKRKKKKQGIGYYFEYPDFPDERSVFTQLYQKNPSDGKMHLMVRPCFPPIYRESNLPDLDTILDVTVVVTDTWKVGDLVDWWCKGCYWSGRLTKELEPGIFKLRLPQPPDGEGKFYDASVKDLRPALNWSPEDGWLVPVPKGSRNSRPCARLIKPVIPAAVPAVEGGKKDGIQKNNEPSLDGRVQTVQTCDKTSVHSSSASLASVASDSSSLSLERLEHQREENVISKRMKLDGAFSSNTKGTDTLEDAILDLEELVNQIKWMKQRLDIGIPLTDPVKPSWEFVEPEPPSKPK